MIERFIAWIGRTARQLPEVVGPGLIALAEGAWIAVVYLVLEIAAHGERPLGPLSFALVAGGGMLVGIRTRTGRDRTRGLAAALTVTALAGWLVAGGTIARLGVLDGGGAIAAHPGGLLLGVAALRGVLRGRSLADADAGATGFGGPAIALACAWLMGGALAGPGRSTFAGDALGPTILFVVAGPTGTAVGRVAALARSEGFAWVANRAWLALLVGGSLVVAGLATFGTSVGLEPIRGVAPALIAILGLILVLREPAPQPRPGSGRRTALGWIVILGALALVLVLPRATPQQAPNAPATTTPVEDSDAAGRQGGTLLVGVGLAVAAGVAIYALRRRWASPRVEITGIVDERRVEVDWHAFVGGWRWRPRRRERHRPPVDAAGAYREALAALAADPSTRREPGESPAAHARRLRSDGTGGFALDLLAADYELDRFGGRSLSRGEHRRALARWIHIAASVRTRTEGRALARLAEAARSGDGGAAGRAEAKDAASASRDGRA